MIGRHVDRSIEWWVVIIRMHKLTRVAALLLVVGVGCVGLLLLLLLLLLKAAVDLLHFSVGLARSDWSK